MELHFKVSADLSGTPVVAATLETWRRMMPSTLPWWVTFLIAPAFLILGCGETDVASRAPGGNDNAVHYRIVAESDGVQSLVGARELVDKPLPRPPTQVTFLFPPPPVPVEILASGSFDLVVRDSSPRQLDWDVSQFEATAPFLTVTADSGSIAISHDSAPMLTATLVATVNGRSVEISGEAGPQLFADESPPRFRGIALSGDGVYLTIVADPVR